MTRPSDVQVSDGGDAVVRCEAGGEPHPHVAWKRLTSAASPVDSAASWTPLSTSDPSQLLLKNMRRADSGVYSCSASNGIGADLSAHFSVTIMGMPFPPLLSAPLLNSPATRTTLFGQSEACSSQTSVPSLASSCLSLRWTVRPVFPCLCFSCL